MPPKSTWFAPKLPRSLIIRLLDKQSSAARDLQLELESNAPIEAAPADSRYWSE